MKASDSPTVGDVFELLNRWRHLPWCVWKDPRNVICGTRASMMAFIKGAAPQFGVTASGPLSDAMPGANLST